MSLGQHQELFALLLPRLLDFIQKSGYRARLRELFRSDEQAEIHALGHAGRDRLALMLSEHPEFVQLARALRNNTGNGVRESVHSLGIAVDIMLFDEDGTFLTDTEDYAFAGDYWKRLHPACRWGGDFRRRDGVHFSLAWGKLA